MTEQVIFQSFVLNDRNETINYEDGKILCCVLEDGDVKYVAYPKEILQNAGLLPREENLPNTTTTASNPLTATASKPLTATVSKPLTATVSKPLTATVSKPLTATVSKPLTATVLKPSTATVSKPLIAAASNSSLLTAAVSNPLTDAVSNPSNAATTKPFIAAFEQSESSLSSTDESDKREWSDGATRFLLDKYETYMKSIGPMKPFKNKKAMWIKISEDLSTIMGVQKGFSQCETRYKTIMKRKRSADENNKTSGSTRTKIDFEEEINKIASNDDSLEPEVLRGVKKVIVSNKKSGSPRYKCFSPQRKGVSPLKKKRKDSLVEALIAINKEKEAAKENRHREKMELLEKLFKKS